MKQLLIGSAIVALGMLAACGGGENYKVTVLPGDDGKVSKGDTLFLYDYDTDAKLDSAVVADSVASFSGSVEGSKAVALKLGNKRIATFILEKGDIKVDFKNGETVGSPLNDKDNEITKKVNDLIADFSETSAKLKNFGTTAEDSVVKVEKLEEQLDSTITDLYRTTFEENKDNALGYLYFLEYAYGLDKKGLDEALVGVPDWFKNSVRVARLKEAAELQDKTAPGKMFTDFSVETSDGKTVKLSDFVGKGEYVLVDFWASWCGPCRREMPGLKEIYNKYEGKGLKVLGVAVWDTPADTKQAVAELQLPWTIIDNAQRVPTDLYGITGIPHIIMFAPDGKIAFRGLTGNKLHAAVDSAMANVKK